MRFAEAGILELQKCVDTQIIIPNQNLFRVANEKTTFADAFAMADQVLYSGVACITDLMVKEGLINLDFADVRAVMREMGKAMMGTGEASGEKRALRSAEAAIANPLIDDVSMRRPRPADLDHRRQDLTLYEVDEPPPASARRSTRKPTSSSRNLRRDSRRHHPRLRWWRPASTPLPHAQRPPVDNNRLAELTQAAAESIPSASPPSASSVTTRTLRLSRRRPVRCRRRRLLPPWQHRPRPRPSFEHAAAAAVRRRAAARAADHDRRRHVRSISPKPSLFVEPMMPSPRRRTCRSRSFRRSPSARAPRCRIDELPMPAQNQLRARR